MLKKLNLFYATALMLFVFGGAAAISAQTSAFTYQGRFTDSSVQQPTNGNYNMTFRLYDAATNGTQIPNNSTAVTALVTVVNGIFTTRLDFGAAAFNTTGARFLEIQVGQTFLTPRQEITSTPFSQRALNAANADSLGGVAANQYVRTTDARLSDARTPTAGSNNYIQNTTAQQTGNFNVSGNGTIGGTISSTKVSVTGGVLARGGTPGGFGANNNGYAFNGSGDTDGGLFSDANGRVSIYTDSTERLRVEGATTTITGNITATGTISGTLADNSVGTAQVTDGSLRLSDISILNLSSSLGPFTVNANSCQGINVNLPSAPTAIGDVLYVYPSNATPAGIFVQATVTTSTTTNPFYICNALNTNIVFPAQTIRYHFVRP